MSGVGCGVGPSFPSYKGKNTLERFLLRGVIDKARAHPILHMRSLPDFEQRNCVSNAKLLPQFPERPCKHQRQGGRNSQHLSRL